MLEVRLIAAASLIKQGGEDPLYVARRLIRIAVEDIGHESDPTALSSALAAYQSCQLIGMPECDVILAEIVVRFAEAPKSTRVYGAYGRAKALVRSETAHPVPMHIRNAPTKLMKELGYGRDYLCAGATVTFRLTKAATSRPTRIRSTRLSCRQISRIAPTSWLSPPS